MIASWCQRVGHSSFVSYVRFSIAMMATVIELVSFVPSGSLSDEGKNQMRKSQRTSNLIENGGIGDGCRHAPGLAIGDFLHGAAQNLARARLRQPSNRNRKLEGGNRADLVADESNAFPPISLTGRWTPVLSTTKPQDTSPLSVSAMPITAHSATSLCAVSTFSMPPVESRWPATLMMSSVRLTT